MVIIPRISSYLPTSVKADCIDTKELPDSHPALAGQG
jgi:hypothetical protein